MQRLYGSQSLRGWRDPSRRVSINRGPFLFLIREKRAIILAVILHTGCTGSTRNYFADRRLDQFDDFATFSFPSLSRISGSKSIEEQSALVADRFEKSSYIFFLFYNWKAALSSPTRFISAESTPNSSRKLVRKVFRWRVWDMLCNELKWANNVRYTRVRTCTRRHLVVTFLFFFFSFWFDYVTRNATHIHAIHPSVHAAARIHT